MLVKSTYNYQNQNQRLPKPQECTLALVSFFKYLSLHYYASIKLNYNEIWISNLTVYRKQSKVHRAPFKIVWIWKLG